MSTPTILCYKSCSTCKNVIKMMNEKNFSYTYREISTENPSIDELKAWKEKSGLELKKFFNTSGLLYKEMELSKKIKTMTEEEMYSILSTNGMLVKRPILVLDNVVLVGKSVKEYIEAI